MKSKKVDWLIFVLFICLTFFLRFPAFFQSGIGPDESIYLLMARSLTEGQPPYTEFFDNKPIGIYILFALALIIFGKSVLSIRIAAWIAVSITSYLLYRLGKLISGNDNKVGLLAGTFYGVLTIGSGGISSDTEIFFAPFVVFAFYLIFCLIVNQNETFNQSYLRLFIIGLLMGIGLQIKQVVLFEFIGILILVGLTLYFQYRYSLIFLLKEVSKCYAVLGFGFILPFLITIAYYLQSGHFNNFFYANFSANLARVGGQNWSLSNFGIGFLIQIKTNLILWICLISTPFYWLSSQSSTPEERRNLTYLIIWFAMAFFGVCAPKSFYVHYFLQVLPSLCILSSYIIIKTIWSAREIGTTRRFLILSFILLTPLFTSVYPLLKVGIKSVYFRYVKGIDNWGDDPAIIAKYLKHRVKSEEYIYVVDYLSVMYFLVPAKIPTKYAYPPFLHSSLAKVAGSNPAQELRSIFYKRPIYVIKIKQNRIEAEPFYKELDGYLKKAYILEKDFPLESEFDAEKEKQIVELYRLKP
jgi:4-amino-4-deoxy-L-arabinose transferase-like glycosyltransferase